MQPDRIRGALSAIGSGDNGQFTMQSAVVSGQGAFEFAFGAQETDMGRWISFPVIIQYNIVSSSAIIRQDTFQVRHMSSSANSQKFSLGLRTRRLSDFGQGEADKFLISAGFDYSFSNHTVQEPMGTDLNFSTHSLSLSAPFACLVDVGIGDFGVTLSPIGSYLIIDNVTPRAFQRAVNSSQSLSSQYIGFGGRCLVQLNDFSFFFEVKKNYAIGKQATVPGLNDDAIVSFGANAMGKVFRFEPRD